jgi:glycosyltransferase involved in cell wall biosynthesis
MAVGGAENQLVRLALHLNACGHSIMVATILPDGRGRVELEAAGIPHEVLPHRGRAGGAKVSLVDGVNVLWGAIRLLRKWRPDVVVSFLFYANVLARLAAFIARAPVVISSVRTERFGGRISDAVLALTDPLSSVTVTNAQSTARRLRDDRIVREKRLLVIPNGVSLEAFADTRSSRGATRSSLGVSDQDFLWVAVGHLEPIKDYPTLLRAVALLRQSGFSVKLRIAAEGSQREALEALVRDLDLSGNVSLLGFRRDVPALLAAADALVLTSLWEGLPNIVMEAFASGLPVVATYRGGTTEIVEPGINGLLVPPKDAQALSAAMGELMQLPAERRSEMGAAGRRLVQERFELDQVMGRWEELISTLLKDSNEKQLRGR